MFTTLSVQLSPEGTILRSWSYGEHNYARVEGDKIMPSATPPVADAPPAPAPAPAPRCKTDFDPGWDLPERRKFRCRLEDVAY
jgi:hypothetical protein